MAIGGCEVSYCFFFFFQEYGEYGHCFLYSLSAGFASHGGCLQSDNRQRDFEPKILK